ncbi:MAG: hypothetical protein ACR2FO_06080 [Actinomycetota bacterium]
MSVTERSRHELFKKLEKVLGMEDAGTLMDLVPPMGWGDMATKRDLDEFTVATKRDIDEFRVATKRDIDEFRVATKRDIDEFRVATKRDMDLLKSDLKDELTLKLRGLFFAIAALFIGVVSLLLAVPHLI